MKLKLLSEMAYPRAVFINKLEETIGGALGEYYKAEYAKANNLTEWVPDWEKEVNHLLRYTALHTYTHPITFTDRKKALAQAITELRANDRGYRTYALNRILTIYKLKKLKHKPPTDITDRFYQQLAEHIAAAETPNQDI